MRRILVLRGGALGDFVVTLPTLLALRERWPRAWITLVGNAPAAELARRRGLLDEVFSQHERRWSELHGGGALSADLTHWLQAFDLVINYWPDPDAAISRRFPLTPQQRFVSAPAHPLEAPAAAHYARALAGLGVEPAAYACSLEPARVTEARVGPRLRVPSCSGWINGATRPLQRSSRLLAIHPGSGSKSKNWPRERWLELLTRLDRPLAIVVGEVEAADWCHDALRRTPLAARLGTTITVFESRPLEELVTLFHECAGFVGHDSGISHLAAACGAPCVLLFGPTSPAIWAPPVPNVTIIRGGDDLRAIPVDAVAKAIA